MNHVRSCRTPAPWLLASCAPLVACACERPPATPADPGPPEPTVEYVAKQQILTDLPMRVRLPARYGAERVLVFVRLWGTSGWRTLELDRDGQAWQGAVSCRAVSTVTGDTRYFFLALDAHGEPVIQSGSAEWPHVATVVRVMPEGPQGLPDHSPPATCFDPADCPAGLPGCPAYAALRSTCSADGDCATGRCAWDGYCEAVDGRGASDPEELDVAVREAIRGARSAKGGTPINR
ncbi:MAG: hypothetical protein ACLQVI_20835 [Polyangiaceae bacterium]